MQNVNLKKVLDALGKVKYLLLVLAVGVLLMLLPGTNRSPPSEAKETDTASAVYPLEDFERRLEESLASVEGVGRVQVLVTLKTDMELKLQEDRRENQTREYADGQLSRYSAETDASAVLYSADGTGEAPLVVKRIYPEFQGAFVVCDGADNVEIRLRIVEAVTRLTGLGADKITVVKMKQQ